MGGGGSLLYSIREIPGCTKLSVVRNYPPLFWFGKFSLFLKITGTGLFSLFYDYRFWTIPDEVEPISYEMMILNIRNFYI